MENNKETKLKAKKIDICVCIKNRGNFVKHIITQLETITKNLDCNIIFVDGMSDDNTVVQLIDFYKTHKDNCTIRQLDENNSNYVEAYNKALSNCVSKYICWLDSDDICESTKLEKQAQFLDNHKDIDVVSCSTYLSNKQILSNTSVELTNEQITEGLKNGATMKDICHFQSCMFRKKCLSVFKKKRYFFDEFIGGYAGEGFLYILHFNGMKFYNINSTYYVYTKGMFKDGLTSRIDPLFAKDLDNMTYDERKAEMEKLLDKYNKI